MNKPPEMTDTLLVTLCDDTSDVFPKLVVKRPRDLAECGLDDFIVLPDMISLARCVATRYPGKRLLSYRPIPSRPWPEKGE